MDPAQGTYDGLPAADYILITDIHGDHMAPAVVEKLKKAVHRDRGSEGCGREVPRRARHGQRRYQEVGDFKIEAIPMYNMKPAADGQIYHEKGRGNGYILTYGGKRFYFAGDTEGTRRCAP